MRNRGKRTERNTAGGEHDLWGSDTRETQVNGLQAAMEDLGMQVSLEVNLCLCFAVDYAFIANGPGGCCRR